MRFNERELARLAEKPGDLEGRLSHRAPRSGLRDERCRERWFKLVRNLLFYYRLNEHGGVAHGEPAGLFVLENCQVRLEPLAVESPFCFSLTLNGESERRHQLSCLSAAAAEQWVQALTAASYQTLRAQLKELRSRMLVLSGVDPLKSRPGARALKNLTSVEEALPTDEAPTRPDRVKRKHHSEASFHSHVVPSDNTSSLLD